MRSIPWVLAFGCSVSVTAYTSVAENDDGLVASWDISAGHGVVAFDLQDAPLPIVEAARYELRVNEESALQTANTDGLDFQIKLDGPALIQLLPR